MDLNCINIIGRLTKNVEIKYTQNGVAVASCSIAVDGFGKDKTYFFFAKAFKQTAETMSKFCTKGDRIAITGSLAKDEWADEEKGTKNSLVYIIINSLQFLTTKKEKQEKSTNNSNIKEGVSADSTIEEDDDMPF